MGVRTLLVLLIVWAAVAGCDRNIEPFVLGEKPQKPDLSKIFPAGAEQSARGGAPAAAPMGGRGAPPVGASGEPIEVRVEIAEELSGRAPMGAVLFLVARIGVAGPPIAVKRITSPQFPLDFAIGPEDRMVDTVAFAGPLHIDARLDADGDAATRERGDLQGRLPEAVTPGTGGLTLSLDEIL